MVLDPEGYIVWYHPVDGGLDTYRGSFPPMASRSFTTPAAYPATSTKTRRSSGLASTAKCWSATRCCSPTTSSSIPTARSGHRRRLSRDAQRRKGPRRPLLRSAPTVSETEVSVSSTASTPRTMSAPGHRLDLRQRPRLRPRRARLLPGDAQLPRASPRSIESLANASGPSV